METEYKIIIKRCFDKGISLAGTTSVLIHCGITGFKYMELKKLVTKEYQRLK